MCSRAMRRASRCPIFTVRSCSTPMPSACRKRILVYRCAISCSRRIAMSGIDRRERLIVALDVPSAAEARALVERLGPAACFYKIGLELAMAPGYFELLEWLTARGKRVFADLKLFDIPETV